MGQDVDFPKARIWKMEDHSGDWAVALPWTMRIVTSWQDAIRVAEQEREVYRLKLDLMDKNERGEITAYSTGAEVIKDVE